MTSGGLSGGEMHRIQVSRLDMAMIVIGRDRLRIISGGTCRVIGAECVVCSFHKPNDR